MEARPRYKIKFLFSGHQKTTGVIGDKFRVLLCLRMTLSWIELSLSNLSQCFLASLLLS